MLCLLCSTDLKRFCWRRAQRIVRVIRLTHKVLLFLAKPHQRKQRRRPCRTKKSAPQVDGKPGPHVKTQEKRTAIVSILHSELDYCNSPAHWGILMIARGKHHTRKKVCRAELVKLCKKNIDAKLSERRARSAPPFQYLTTNTDRSDADSIRQSHSGRGQHLAGSNVDLPVAVQASGVASRPGMLIGMSAGRACWPRVVHDLVQVVLPFDWRKIQ